MAFINKKLLEHCAYLSRLKFTEHESKKFVHDLGAVLKYVQELEAVDGKGIEPMTGAAHLKNIFRDDAVDLNERALAVSDEGRIITAFPESDRGLLKVPKIL